MFRNYIKTTFRTFSRNKLNTIINIIGLTVSIACCIVVYVFIKHEQTFDAFHAKANRTYRIVFDDKTNQNVEYGGYANFAIAGALRSNFSQLENVTQLYTGNYGLIKISDGKTNKIFEEQEMTYADEGFFKMFDFSFIAGNKNAVLHTPDEVLLTKKLADKYFGSQYKNNYNNLIGKTIIINKKNYRITGILKDMPRNSNVACNIILPFKDFERNNPALMHNWIDTYSSQYVFVTLASNYSAAEFDKALVDFKNKNLDAEHAKRITYHPQLLTKVHTDEKYGGTLYATPSVLITAFILMGVIVLITACINFINLATVQSLKRSKEVGIRKTLGSRKYQLVLQFMSETFILILLASLLSLLLANWFLNAFNQYLLFTVDLGLHIDYSIIIFLLALGVFITFLAGFYPAKILSGYDAVKALKGGIKTEHTGFRKRFSLRKILVVTQFVVTQLLIIGTIVVASQMKYFYSYDTGYTKDKILTIEMPVNDAQKFDLFKTRLLSNTNIKNVTFSSGPPTSSSNSFGDIRLPSAPETDNINVEKKFVDDAYLKTYGIHVLAGRDLWVNDKLTLSDSTNTLNILLNKKAVIKLGLLSPENAVGKKIVLQNKQSATIVGVTDDFYNVSLQNEVNPCLLFYATNWVNMASVKLNNNNASVNSFIQKAWQSVYPEQVYKSATIDEYMYNHAFYVLEDVMYKGFKIFVVISILIGCMGLYGLIAFMAVQRQKEIGIRKVLGASVNTILYMFSKEFLWLVLIAFLIAAPLGYTAMNSWLQTFTNKINLTAMYFMAALFISLMIAAGTILFQAVKAATANPIKSLRSE